MTHQERSGPLTGLRVVEIAGMGPGPHAATILADLGADVVRIDRPGGGTLTLVPPEADFSTRGRPSVALDLKQPEAVAALLDMVSRADILIEGFRPGVAERLGIGPDVCFARNPRLVYGRITGWGQDGPLSQTAGHDLAYIAVTGALHAAGQDPDTPHFPSNLLGDFGGGSTYLAIGVLAAVLEARSSGRGQVVDAAIVDGLAEVLQTHSPVNMRVRAVSVYSHLWTVTLPTVRPFSTNSCASRSVVGEIGASVVVAVVRMRP